MSKDDLEREHQELEDELRELNRELQRLNAELKCLRDVELRLKCEVIVEDQPLLYPETEPLRN